VRAYAGCECCGCAEGEPWLACMGGMSGWLMWKACACAVAAQGEHWEAEPLLGKAGSPYLWRGWDGQGGGAAQVPDAGVCLCVCVCVHGPNGTKACMQMCVWQGTGCAA